jgi:hypothetical protein
VARVQQTYTRLLAKAYTFQNAAAGNEWLMRFNGTHPRKLRSAVQTSTAGDVRSNRVRQWLASTLSPSNCNQQPTLRTKLCSEQTGISHYIGKRLSRFNHCRLGLNLILGPFPLLHGTWCLLCHGTVCSKPLRPSCILRRSVSEPSAPDHTPYNRMLSVPTFRTCLHTA